MCPSWPEASRDSSIEEATGRPVSFFYGAPEAEGAPNAQTIQYMEATSVKTVPGATSWGFSIVVQMVLTPWWRLLCHFVSLSLSHSLSLSLSSVCLLEAGVVVAHVPTRVRLSQ